MSENRAAPPAEITPEEFFSSWAPAAVAADPKRKKGIADLDAAIQFRLTGVGGGDYYLRIVNATVQGGEGLLAEPDLTLRTDIETWRALNAGEIKAPNALIKGKLRYHGSTYLALKLHFIIG